jgi:hypothetical protein
VSSPVIPKGVCEVRNLSLLDILTEEGFLAALGIRNSRIFCKLVPLDYDLRRRFTGAS